MKLLRHFSTAALLAIASSAIASSANVAYAGRKVGRSWYHVVVANLNSDSVRLSGMVNQKLGHSESFWQLINRCQPLAAISGTFFDIRTARPIGSIVIDGNGVWEGYHGSCLALDYFNQARILDPKWGRKVDTAEYRFMVRGGIRLLSGGELSVYPRAQKFRDPRVTSRARRIAVGVTDSNKLLMVGTNANVTLRTLAYAMRSLGARNAIALDGGTSAALYYNGKLLMRPGRKLTNLITLHQGNGIAWETNTSK
jgi:hypothetical protein